MARQGDTADRILDVAEGLLQRRGYNGFAYKDIAALLGIRNASIHFHFPAKADLGTALARRYRERFLAALEAIEAETPGARQRLQRFAGLFEATFAKEGAYCLCGMLGMELGTLPEPVAAEAGRFFKAARAWLVRVLEDGQARGELAFTGPAAEQAELLLALLEGGMVVSRALAAPERYAVMARQAVTSLVGAS
jgi:TetR/AcrR family transcriptional repressor of nem operon